MITDNEKFIEIQGILSLSNISSNDCIKINNLIIELSKENKQLKEKVIDISNCIKYRNVNSAIQQQVLSYQIELENHYKIRYYELHNNWNKLKEFVLKKQAVLFNTEYTCYSNILDKMQELEQGSDSNEKSNN